MPRSFNIAGPCDPAVHYMLPPERRLPAVRGYIDQRYYFVIHAPRQVGKTTSVRTLAKSLQGDDRYTALYASCENAQASGGDLKAGIQAVIDSIGWHAREQLPEWVWPPEPVREVSPEIQLQEFLSNWARSAPRPLVLFLDEIDSLLDATLISVLRQLRTGYPVRPGSFPQSVVLIGLRDVRDYRLQVRPETITL